MQARENQQAEKRHWFGDLTENIQVIPFNPFNRTRETPIRPVSVQEKLKRMLQLDEENSWTAKPGQAACMITKIIIHPNPFESFLAMEITCVQSKHLIIRVTDSDERIVKMFSWFVVKGTNVSTFNEMDSLSAGHYCLDIMDLEGELLFSTELEKR